MDLHRNFATRYGQEGSSGARPDIRRMEKLSVYHQNLGTLHQALLQEVFDGYLSG